MEKAEFVTAFEDPESDIPFTAFDMPKDGHSVCLQGMSLHTRGQLFHSSNAFPF
jgi:hypothetical protein